MGSTNVFKSCPIYLTFSGISGQACLKLHCFIQNKNVGNIPGEKIYSAA